MKGKFKDSKLFKAVKQYAPDLIDGVLTLGSTVYPPLGSINKLIQGKKEDVQNSIINAYEQDLKAFALEVEDRKSARNLFTSDSITQKVLALVFTVAYFYMSKYMLDHFFKGEKLEDYQLAFVSSMFGAMSAKINTIIDFFFGGSVKA